MAALANRSADSLVRADSGPGLPRLRDVHRRWHLLARRIHQSLEPAHRLVFGYGLIAWEFSEGARNWAFPGLIAGVMGATAGLGGDSPHVYLPVIRLVFVAMSLGVALGIYRLARIWSASEEAAAAGAAAWALAAPSIYFAHRAMSENAATFAAVWGVGFLLAPTPLRPGRRSLLVPRSGWARRCSACRSCSAFRWACS